MDDRSRTEPRSGTLARMRPTLRPGTHVLRRGGHELQVGLDPGGALVLTGTPPVRESLRLLTASADLREYDDAATVELLRAHDLVVDDRDVKQPLADGGLSRAAAAALTRSAGPRAGDAARARRSCRVEVRGFGHPVGEGLPGRLRSLLRAGGVGEPGPGPDPTPGAGAEPDCGVLVGVGEPERERLDGWTRAGTPYLLVRLAEGRAVVGPFVVPGSTACLRCVDAHCSDADPAWPLLVRQYADASSRDRPDGVTEPLDPLLATLALSWAARDVASYAERARPSTWSATVTLHPQLTRLDTDRWPRHPGCGCSWA